MLGPSDTPRALRRAAWARLLLGHRVTNGAAVGVGLVILSSLLYALGGLAAAASASVGMLIMSIGDQTAPARGKFTLMAPLLWLAVPLWLLMQLAHLAPEHSPLLIGLLVCAGGFLGMLGTAWGARGAPLGFALVLAMIFALASPPAAGVPEVLVEALWFELGALLYTGYAVLAARVLNERYREQALADALAELAQMLRQQAERFSATADRRAPQIQRLLGEQAALADKLQTARDLVLDSPATPRQHRLAAMLIAALRLRAEALACELGADGSDRGALPPAAGAHALETLWRAAAEALELVSWSMYGGGSPRPDTAGPVGAALSQAQAQLPPELRAPAEAIAAETRRIVEVAAHPRQPVPPPDAAEVALWTRFLTPMQWPLAPLRRAFASGRSPVLRYAVRVAAALALGQLVSRYLPWAAHPQWILLTIAVVMRTNLAQTLERRNARLAGTLIGCVIVGALLSLQPSVPLQFAVIALGVAISHGFAVDRYLVASAAATVLALLQGHLMHTATEFSLYERLIDTLIGTAIAWAFSFVLPAWERGQLPPLVKRLREAHLKQAQLALDGPLTPSGHADWRIARREVQDSLTAFALASQRALAEPAGVQPPLDLLERLQLRSYRLLSQLDGLRQWREESARAQQPPPDGLAQTLAAIEAALAARQLPETAPNPSTLNEHHTAGERQARDATAEARAVARELLALDEWQQRRRAEAARGVFG